jgi:hypothetical protein
MAVRKDLRPLLVVAVLGVLIALAETITGLDTGLLLLSPALVLLLPLLAGRYVGEDALERFAARRSQPRGRASRAASAPLPRRRPRTVVVRGGRLIAAALAERGPPLTA